MVVWNKRRYDTGIIPKGLERIIFYFDFKFG